MKDPRHPSMDVKWERPHAWIQWKGTDVCMDIRCECGEDIHFDGMFAYHIKCLGCGAVYECDGHIKLHKLDFEPEHTKCIETEPDEEDE
jgi:hypothetical protein